VENKAGSSESAWPYAVEACPLLARQTLSFEFTLTRIFMKLFRTSSSKVLNERQVSFGFLPAKSQILIRTASFLQKFTVSENSLCMLFANDARRQLDNIFYTIWWQYSNRTPAMHCRFR